MHIIVNVYIRFIQISQDWLSAGTIRHTHTAPSGGVMVNGGRTISYVYTVYTVLYSTFLVSSFKALLLDVSHSPHSQTGGRISNHLMHSYTDCVASQAVWHSVSH